MGRVAVVAYRLVCYLAFLASFAWLFCFVGDFFLPHTVDRGRAAPLAEALAVDVGWFVLFSLQHSLMARESFKRRWTRLVPAATERSHYVLASSLMMGLLFWQWRPLPAVVWEVASTPWRQALVALYLVGWALLVASSFLIDHFELFGLRDPVARPLSTPLLYRWVRHPIYVGYFVVFWATPRMTVGHVLLATGMSACIAIGVYFEERDLVRHFGDAYRDYQARVPMLLPFSKRGRKAIRR
ncbi:MAG TPA: isoprenylcysteine carboxylmethyltransferase family protein [Polyangia bacterium]